MLGAVPVAHLRERLLRLFQLAATTTAPISSVFTMAVMAMAILVGRRGAGLTLFTAWQRLTYGWHTVRTVWVGFLASRPTRMKP